ncbi:MAG: MATE family efflux transporter [Holdemania massiliensis]
MEKFSAAMKFTVPIMIALILQALYGAVDLLVVGQFASPEAVSAVATGSQVMHTMMVIITGLAMGITVLIGSSLAGANRKKWVRLWRAVFSVWLLALILTGIMLFATPALVTLMQAPAEAVAFTNQYVLICSGGILFIAAYNTLGSIFRGLGDARTPLLAVAIACAANIVLDLLLVAGFKMGAAGAALATVIQAIGVICR